MFKPIGQWIRQVRMMKKWGSKIGGGLEKSLSEATCARNCTLKCTVQYSSSRLFASALTVISILAFLKYVQHCSPLLCKVVISTQTIYCQSELQSICQHFNSYQHFSMETNLLHCSPLLYKVVISPYAMYQVKQEKSRNVYIRV